MAAPVLPSRVEVHDAAFQIDRAGRLGLLAHVDQWLVHGVLEAGSPSPESRSLARPAPGQSVDCARERTAGGH